MSLRSGERQVATTLEEIRADHVARYRWAAAMLPPASRVVDFGCGVGYGAKILAEAGHKVTAYDIDAETIRFAREHFAHPGIDYVEPGQCRMHEDDLDAIVAFEVIEHVADPAALLALFEAPLLLASVPNEEVFPFRNYDFHHRHYRPGEFQDLLARAGYGAESWWGQAGPHSDVEAGVAGRTLLAIARRGAVACEAGAPTVASATPLDAPPSHVIILGMGPSLESYVDLAKRAGGRHVLSDEVWGINQVGDVIRCDRIFHMDDVRIQMLRAEAAPDSNIARMMEWMRRHPGPIYTSRAHPDFAGLVEYPLQDVINSCGFAYFNSTAAYAVAYAVHIGVKRISCFGFDFTYADAHKAERGRACVEFHLGIAAARGIQIGFPENTTLMDAIAPDDERIYGYDTLDIEMIGGGDQLVTVSFKPKEIIPTAAEIERRYDHARHPNHLVRKD